MFLTQRRAGYDRGGNQVASGLFLILVSNPDRSQNDLRAFVRFVSMEQCGHFMMGNVRVAGYSLSLSGAYGNDGLPTHLDRFFAGIVNGEAKFVSFTAEQKTAIWDQLTPLPPELVNGYWHSEGHNDAGTAGPEIRKWAKANMLALQKTIHRV